MRSLQAIPSWLVVVSQNAAVSVIRRINRMPGLTELNDDIATDATPRSSVQDSDLYSQIEEFLDTLSMKERRIVSLEYQYGLKHREIAQLMDMPINTVSTILSRAKKSLRQRLKERGFDVS